MPRQNEETVTYYNNLYSDGRIVAIDIRLYELLQKENASLKLLTKKLEQKIKIFKDALCDYAKPNYDDKIWNKVRADIGKLEESKEQENAKTD